MDMTFIGYTAAIDAAIALITWSVLINRRELSQKKAGAMAETFRYFSSYLLATFTFLVLIAYSMIALRGPAQALMVMVADLVLWLSLAYFVMLVFVGRPAAARNVMLTLLITFGSLGTIYQAIGLGGTTLNLGPITTYILTNMGPLMMYAVWLPSALLFLTMAFETEHEVVRSRSLMFCIGLLLMTFSWAFRLLTLQPPLVVVTLSSILGFELLLGGVVYRGATARQTTV